MCNADSPARYLAAWYIGCIARRGRHLVEWLTEFLETKESREDAAGTGNER